MAGEERERNLRSREPGSKPPDGVREPDRTGKTDADWRRALTPEQYRVCRLKGTEPAFTGKYWDCKDPGVYRCVACGTGLFSSETKYDSGSGWPSFWEAIDRERVKATDDFDHGMHRVEISCGTCGAHLGHLFEDGPEPTGNRYCINSAALDLEPRK